MTSRIHTISRTFVALSAAVLVALVVPSADADTITFLRDGDVWRAAPDGSRQVRLTTDGGYAAPSQADAGTIVAVRDRRLQRLDAAGTKLGAPIDTWVTRGGADFLGPYGPRISPDGTRVAYTWGINELVCTPGVGCDRQPTFGTAYSFADRYTDPSELGRFTDWASPSWIDDGHTIVFNPGAGLFSETSPNVAFHELGHSVPGSSSDLDHVYRFLDDSQGPYVHFGQLARTGDAFAGGEGIDPNRIERIRLYATGGRPQGGAPYPTPAFGCQLEHPPGGAFTGLSWSPSGDRLAYAAGDAVYVVTVGDLRSGCTVGSPAKILDHASQPFWSPAALGADLSPGSGPGPAPDTSPGLGLDAKPGTKPRPGASPKLRIVVAVARGQHLERVLAKGLRVGVRLRTGSGRVTVRLVGRTPKLGTAVVASTTVKIAKAGTRGRRTVLLRPSRAARRKLARRRSASFAVVATGVGPRATAVVKVGR